MKQIFVVVDDHFIIQAATQSILHRQYPEAQILIASTLKEAQEVIDNCEPDLVIADLSIPLKNSSPAQIECGLFLIQCLLKKRPALNIVVQSAHVRSLVRIKSLIDNHQGGFTVVDKALATREMLKLVDWALQGIIYTPCEMRGKVFDLKPEWLQVLQLAFKEGLQDKAIAEKMNCSERSVRSYWSRLQSILNVSPARGHNMRIQTEITARAEGFLD